jgi:hypothetical protein
MSTIATTVTAEAKTIALTTMQATAGSSADICSDIRCKMSATIQKQMDGNSKHLCAKIDTTIRRGHTMTLPLSQLVKTGNTSE